MVSTNCVSCIKTKYNCDTNLAHLNDIEIKPIIFNFFFLPEMDSSFSIIDIFEDGVVREDAKGTEPEIEEE